MAWGESTKDWPCKPDCPKRQPGCHSKCPDYAAAKEKKDARNAMIRAKRGAEHDVTGFITNTISKRTRKPHKQR